MSLTGCARICSAETFGVANKINTFTKLQDILIRAIEALEPPADQPTPAHAWEIYEPLFYRYVEQLSQPQVAKQLGMSVRHLRRKEHAALGVLAAHLWETYDLSAQPATEGSGAHVEEALAAPDRGAVLTPENGHTGPSVRDELRWLRDSVPEVPASLDEAVAEALDLLRPTLARGTVAVQTSLPVDLPELAVHSVALTQSLVNLVVVALHQAECAAVSVTAYEDGAAVVTRISADDASSVVGDLPEGDRAKLELGAELARLGGGSLVHGCEQDTFTMCLRLPSVGRVPVLIIDDNADTLQLLRRYAVGTRYRVFTSQRPGDALAQIENVRPSIVVLDVMMPEVDGWRLLGRLRQHPSVGNLPIVVCSVLPQREIALDLGATGFVQKPVTRQRFLATLDDQLVRTA